MAIHLNFAIENDLDEVSKIFLEILDSLSYYNDLAKRNERIKYATDELRKKIYEDKYSIIVVRDDTILVGFCFSRFDDYTIWLEWFGISKNYRGTEIGNMILSKLEESTLVRGCHKIWCDSRTENVASFKVLQRNGFTLLTTLKNHWYNQDFFIWQKYLG